MSKYIETYKTTNGLLRTKQIKEVFEEQSLPLRIGKIRKGIREQISDRDDLIADLFKLNFLTISALKYVYKALPDDVKDDIPDKARDLLDNSFKKYEDTKTIMDLYIEKGDTSFIDRILDRQAKITEIIENTKG